jgi:hypothetical protein
MIDCLTSNSIRSGVAVPRIKRGLADGGVYHILTGAMAGRECSIKMSFAAFIDLLGQARERNQVLALR